MNSNNNQNNHNNDELFADLFAYRFALLDIYQDDEREIIIKLKLKLFEMNFIPSAINGILHTFYNYYNIPITQNIINNANVMVYMYNFDNNIRSRNNLLYNTILNILDTMNSEVENDEEEKETLTEEEFNELEVIKITHTHLLEDCECSICIDKFELEQDAIKLSCNHLFHKDCIKLHLLNYNDKCPLCRGETK